MKLSVSVLLSLCLAMSVSGQWCWWCFPMCTVSSVYFVPTDNNVTTGRACAAAATNATLAHGSYVLDTTVLQANHSFEVCSCYQKNCTNPRTNTSTVSYVGCHFCTGVGKAIVIPTNVTCH